MSTRRRSCSHGRSIERSPVQADRQLFGGPPTLFKKSYPFRECASSQFAAPPESRPKDRLAAYGAAPDGPGSPCEPGGQAPRQIALTPSLGRGGRTRAPRPVPWTGATTGAGGGTTSAAGGWITSFDTPLWRAIRAMNFELSSPPRALANDRDLPQTVRIKPTTVIPNKRLRIVP